jgi:hypothetical protein
MDAATSSAVRRTILELVGSGHSSAEIRAQLGGQASERDLRYADSLVRVRDDFRHEQVSRRAAAA